MHNSAQAVPLVSQHRSTKVHSNLFMNDTGGKISFTRKADYIGSFLVTGGAHFERADIARQKLEAARGYTQSKPILLVISLHGIKVCDSTGTNVHMAHALRRISYATCDPECCQFAFLAREPKAQPNVQYCHAFVTKTSEEAESLNNLVGEAFRIAYAQQRALMDNRRSAAQIQTSSDFKSGEGAAISAPLPQQSQQRQSPPRPKPPPIPPPVSHKHAAPAEVDSGITTADNTASFQLQKINVGCGYIAAADSGLSSSEFTPRAVKPHALGNDSDNDEHKDLHDDDDDVENYPERKIENYRNPRCSQVQKGLAPDSDQIPVHYSNIRPVNGNHYQRTGKSHVFHGTEDSQIDLAGLNLDEGEGGDIDGYPSSKVLPSAPHSTPLPLLTSPHSRIDINVMADRDEVDGEMANSIVTNHGGQRLRTTPFSPSACSINAYDQASEGHHITPSSVAPRRNRSNAGTDTASISGASSGGAGSDVNSLKTSPGGILNKHHINNGPPVSAPWYQPHIPRELALEILSRQPPGSFVVRDSGTHYNCYALSVRVGDAGSSSAHSSATDRCMSADMALQPPHRGTAPNSDCGGLISHYLIQRTPTGVRLKGLEKEWPSISCLILHLTVMPEMLPCPLLDTPQSSSNPSAFLRNFEKAPDACAFRPISVGASGAGGNSPPPVNSSNPPLPPPHPVDYQQLSEFSSLLADFNSNSSPIPPPRHDFDQHRQKHRRHPPPPPTRIR